MTVETGFFSYCHLLNSYLPGNFRVLLSNSLSGRRTSGNSYGWMNTIVLEKNIAFSFIKLCVICVVL